MREFINEYYCFSKKNRSRPINITNIAISKIPCTKLTGFTSEQNKIIQQRHKELLKDAQNLCKKYNSNEMEVVYLLDIHNWTNIWKRK